MKPRTIHPNHRRALELIRDKPFMTLWKLAWELYPQPGANKAKMRSKGHRLMNALSDAGLAGRTWRGELFLTEAGKRLIGPHLIKAA